MKSIDTILFDLDGVLADTHRWIVSAYEHTAAAYGLEIDRDHLTALFGQPLLTCYVSLSQQPDGSPFAETHRRYQRENLHLVTLFPGVINLLDRLKQSHYALAVVTGRNGPSAADTLHRLSLRSYFDAVVTEDDTREHKPHPAPALRALELLGKNPQTAMMVGDAPADILCGRAAGCATVGVTYGFVGEEIVKSNPDYLVSAPRELMGLLGG
ncbi:pyrophosphatase PpaX [Capsulimonas corticalis]|uniref:Pyrophosphatase PpaX n=1 Tax=Capsulimonas corticalis TaxID=2219043 RepID=A0A402CYB1_9BACT|nr:HAD-IA family hydrolase [Capsulimonas corticalis]BDI31410.1 pyrophosphatase PpaX [Capsulimonas corticalis]